MEYGRKSFDRIEQWLWIDSVYSINKADDIVDSIVDDILGNCIYCKVLKQSP